MVGHFSLKTRLISIIILLLIFVILSFLIVLYFSVTAASIHAMAETLLSSFPYISAFLVAFLAFVIGNWVWNYIQRPKLRIEDVEKEDKELIPGDYIFNPHPTHPKYSNEEDENFGTPDDFHAFTHNLKVTNLGRTAAKNVRVYLRINDSRFEGEKFLIKWKSRPSPQLSREIDYDSLSDYNLAIDLLPGKENYELLSITVRRTLRWVEYNYRYGHVDGVSEVLLIFSPSFYYLSEFKRITLSRADLGISKEKRKDELNADINANLSGTLTVTYEGHPLVYDLIIENVSVMCKNPIKFHLTKRIWRNMKQS